MPREEPRPYDFSPGEYEGLIVEYRRCLGCGNEYRKVERILEQLEQLEGDER